MSEDPFKAIKQIREQAKTFDEIKKWREEQYKCLFDKEPRLSHKEADAIINLRFVPLQDFNKILAEYEKAKWEERLQNVIDAHVEAERKLESYGKAQKQKLQQLFDSIPLEYSKNCRVILGYEFYRLGTKKEWVEFLKKFEDLLKEG